MGITIGDEELRFYATPEVMEYAHAHPELPDHKRNELHALYDRLEASAKHQKNEAETPASQRFWRNSSNVSDKELWEMIADALDANGKASKIVSCGLIPADARDLCFNVLRDRESGQKMAIVASIFLYRAKEWLTATRGPSGACV